MNRIRKSSDIYFKRIKDYSVTFLRKFFWRSMLVFLLILNLDLVFVMVFAAVSPQKLLRL